MTVTIGLLGPAGAGKSSVAKYLEERYGARRYSLATPLKDIAQRTLGFTDDQLYGTQEQKEAVDPRYGFSCRWFLQRLGTEGCRAVLDANVWTDACLRRIMAERPDVAVIEDVRFRNEANAVMTAPSVGYVWRLVPPADEDAAARVDGAGVHASELEWMTASADLEVRPLKRGLDELFALVEDAARSCHLFPLRREVSL